MARINRRYNRNGSESACHFILTGLLVVIVIAMSHVKSPKVLDVQDIPMQSNERVECDLSLGED
jgi:hypothetical protein